jgi:hypothetical protein
LKNSIPRQTAPHISSVAPCRVERTRGMQRGAGPDKQARTKSRARGGRGSRRSRLAEVAARGGRGSRRSRLAEVAARGGRGSQEPHQLRLGGSKPRRSGRAHWLNCPRRAEIAVHRPLQQQSARGHRMVRHAAHRLFDCAGGDLFTRGRAGCSSTQPETGEGADATSPQPSLPNLGIGSGIDGRRFARCQAFPDSRLWHGIMLQRGTTALTLCTP